MELTKHNVIIITAGHPEDCDTEMYFKKYSVEPEQMTHEAFEQMVLERGYELAEEFFEYDDFKFGEDITEGYTERQRSFYIVETILVHFYPEGVPHKVGAVSHQGEIFTRFFGGDSYECWTKPEDDDEKI